MNIVEAVVLGLVQGLTEFIPVSSSGHLVIAQQMFSGASDHLFLEFINIGTFLALLIYFRKRILHILKDVFLNRNFTLARNIFITAIPAGVAGFMLAGFIENAPFFESILIVTISLAVIGVVMIVIEKLPKAGAVREIEDLSSSRALVIGLIQTLALIPGVSRSGSTIIAGRLAGLSGAMAAEYSFLVSLPVMLGVIVKLFIKSSDRTYFFEHLSVLIVSNVVAFIFGLLAVGFLMRYLSKHTLVAFGWYRIGLAAILSVILLVQ